MKARGTGGGPGSPWAFAAVGFEIALPIVLFLYAGYRLDGWLGTFPWLLLAGAMLGIAVGLYGLFRSVRKWSGRADGGRGGSTP